MSSIRINITLDSDLKDQATAFAKERGLSFSALVRLLLVKQLKQSHQNKEL